MKRWVLAALLVSGCAAEQGLEVSYAPVYCDQKPENPRCITRAVPAPTVVAVNICGTKPMATGCPAQVEAMRVEAEAVAQAEAARQAEAAGQAVAPSNEPEPSPSDQPDDRGATILQGDPVRRRRARRWVAPTSGGTVQVRSYTRRNGTVVHGYTRHRR